MSDSLPNDAVPRFLKLSQVTPRSVSWLWPSWLVPGNLVIIDGDPGPGKSWLTLDLCARLTTGRPFPDGSPGLAPSNVIAANGEDGADTVRSRLLGLGADMDRVYIPNENESDTLEPLQFPRDLAILEQVLAESQAKLVVIDPVMAFLDRSINISSDQSVRRALYPLAVLARKYQCVILLVRHLNKNPGRQALYRGGGSIAFTAACRSAWLVGLDPADPERRVLAQVKANLAALQPSLAFQLVPQEGGSPQVSWLGTTALTAKELLVNPAARTAADRPRDRAGALLESFLREGLHTSREVWEFAEEHGLTEMTVRRAKRDLKIRSVRVWAEGQRLSYWLLPEQELPTSLAPDTQESGLEPYLDALRAKYPPPTPLDDL
jgi:hypothetical protein